MQPGNRKNRVGLRDQYKEIINGFVEQIAVGDIAFDAGLGGDSVSVIGKAVSKIGLIPIASLKHFDGIVEILYFGVDGLHGGDQIVLHDLAHFRLNSLDNVAGVKKVEDNNGDQKNNTQ